MKQEFTVKPISGYLALLITILFLGGAIAGFAFNIIWLGVVLSILFIFMTIGFKVVNPNGSLVMVLFGAYKGTIRETDSTGSIPFMLPDTYHSEPVTSTASQ